MTISKDIAEHYRQNSSVQFDLAQKLLETVDFSHCRSILDIGCGMDHLIPIQGLTAKITEHLMNLSN